MLEPLAGRLTWEQTGQGIRVEIPARLSSTIVIRVLWLILWCGAGWLFLSKTHGGHIHSHVQLVWLVGWAAGVILVTASIFWSLAGATTLTLDRNQLQIASRMMGFQLSIQSYANSDVRNLRFIPAMMRAKTNRPSGIWFEANGRLRRFASALTAAEASALIDKMFQVYKFPQDSSGGAFGVPQ
jgi:hypothetical protein